MYKVIRIDNYGRESREETVVQENIATRADADRICEVLRGDASRPPDDWYAVKLQDYVLWRGMAEFVDAEPACKTCGGTGKIDQRDGGSATSAIVGCPDCGNQNKEPK